MMRERAVANLVWCQERAPTQARRRGASRAGVLPFGGLMLAAGSIADRVGRKRTFLAMLAGLARSAFVNGMDLALRVVGAVALAGALLALLAFPAATDGEYHNHEGGSP